MKTELVNLVDIYKYCISTGSLPGRAMSQDCVNLLTNTCVGKHNKHEANAFHGVGKKGYNNCVLVQCGNQTATVNTM